MAAPQVQSVHTVRPAVLADEAGLGEHDRATWSTLHALQPRHQPPYEPFFEYRHVQAERLVAVSAEGGKQLFLFLSVDMRHSL